VCWGVLLQSGLNLQYLNLNVFGSAPNQSCYQPSAGGLLELVLRPNLSILAPGYLGTPPKARDELAENILGCYVAAQVARNAGAPRKRKLLSRRGDDQGGRSSAKNAVRGRTEVELAHLGGACTGAGSSHPSD
jgi:hypothetical protein